MKNKWMSLMIGVGLLLLTIMLGTSAFARQTAAYGGVTDSYATEWYMQPWVWIISGGVFILLFTIIISREDQDA